MVVFLEGLDDDRFFNGIIKPILDDKYDHVKFVQYANKKPEEIRKYLMSIKSTVGADYLFWGDINSSPCITAKKQDLRAKFGKVLDHDKILIVIKEIESWYLAGLSEANCKLLGIKLYNFTNDITKERFEELTPKRFKGFRTDFMREILGRFSVNTAKRKNKSFGYFMSKVQDLS